MRTIAVINLKGGVGKTTTVVNVAAILAAEKKQRVLVIDADSQANTTEFFGGGADKGRLSAILRGYPGKTATADERMCYAVGSIQPTRCERVELLAGDDSLMDLDLSKVEMGTVSATSIYELKALLAARDMFDWCIIDCPPAFNAASAAAMVAADEVIIPIKLDAFSLRGMTNLMRQIANMRKINPGLKLGGCLPTMWYKSEQIMAAEQTLAESGLPVYHHIRRSDTVDKMTFAQAPLRECSPSSAAGIDYRAFVAQLTGEARDHG